MRYPYAEARNFFTKELKKEERKWMRFIAQSEVMIEKMETILQTIPQEDVYHQYYQNAIDVTRSGLEKANEELETVRRNIASLQIHV